MNFLTIKKSANRKTGAIPVTYGSRKSCPPSCPHYEDDCYGEDFHTRLAWNRVDRDGVPLPGLVNFIQSLPEGQIWRDKVVGDLPGKGEKVDPYALGQVVKANFGRRGFTYTHKKSPQAIKWIRHANEWGYTINLSADDAGEADALAKLDVAPVVCVVPMDTPARSLTPEGRDIVVCPAQLKEDVTCLSCQLCQRRDRAVIVGFRAHGSKAKIADAKARKVIPIAKGEFKCK
jgi:hypothetical protein